MARDRQGGGRGRKGRKGRKVDPQNLLGEEGLECGQIGLMVAGGGEVQLPSCLRDSQISTNKKGEIDAMAQIRGVHLEERCEGVVAEV